MSRDPERILSLASDADPFERELFASIHDVSPRAGAKDEAWARIAAQMGAVALVGGSAAAVASHAAGNAAAGAASALSAGAKSGLFAALTQSVAAKVVVGLLVTGGGIFLAVQHGEPSGTAVALSGRGPVATEKAMLSPRSAAAAPDSAPTLAQPAVENDVPGAATGQGEAAQRGSALRSALGEGSQSNRLATPRAPRDDIARESLRLAEARAELRRGNTKGAEAILARLRAEFPKGALGQEREVLSIDVLAAQGNSAGAKRRAQSFIFAHPNSPHNAALSRFLASE